MPPICKIAGKDKSDKKSIKTAKKLVADSDYMCEKCLRCANDKKNLCSPTKLKKKE